MKIFIASEFRCTIYKGKYYLAPKAFSIYKRYADVFGDIFLCCRFQETSNLMDGYQEAYFVKEVLNINSLSSVLLGKYEHSMRQSIKKCDLVIARIPSIIAYRASDYAIKEGVPYLAELMGDAWDSYWNHDICGKIIAPYMHLKMKMVTNKANYAVYVTEHYLQKRYPCKNKWINASNVVIKCVDENVLSQRIEKIKNMNTTHISLMTTAAVDVRTKGQQFVIRAINGLKEKGIEVTYYLAGGENPQYLKELAKKEDVENNVVFLGELTIKDVYKYLDMIDIYIQPSLQEGLPRSVIEAMSRGCPCVGSRTAGTPELLDERYIFERASVIAIEEAVKKILNDDMQNIARCNFEFSKHYLEETLNDRRNRYFKDIYFELKKKEEKHVK